MEKNFVHLHLHTEYSLLDGVGKIDEYIKKAKKFDMPAIAITDHGNMFGAIEFYKKAIKNNIKPIIGLEAYVSEFEMDKKEGRNFHLVLLAKNNTGYQNLLKITSAAYIDGFYYKPRIDKEFLKKHSEGLIALSACMNGEISRRILENEDEKVIKDTINLYIDIFGNDDFYLEVQGNGLSEQDYLNAKLYDLAKSYNLKLVATNDTHYLNKGDHILQDIVICIQTGAKIQDEKRMKIQTHDLYFKNRDQMIDGLTEKYLEAIDNTLEIADKCNVNIEFGKFIFPDYKIPSEFNDIESYLRFLVYKGLNKIYNFNITEKIRKRIEYELSIIEKMGYAGYFIVVWDFINYANSQNIPIGPGRGSAAGSMVAYALGITKIDPIKYNLIFERFLNPERISMPDIDIDICQERRQEVIDYVVNKYGADKVAQIITFGTMKARAAIRDVGRVMDIPLQKVDNVAKLMSANLSIEKNLNTNPELKEIYLKDKEIQNMIDISARIENKVRHASIHAAGIVITKDPLTQNVPLYSDNKDVVSTQYQMRELEDLGILKMDFLGLRNLTNIQRTIDYIFSSTNEKIILNDIPLDEEKVYNMLSIGDTTGIFQLESRGIRKILRKLKPDKFEDIIALLALYRPGPLGSGMVDDFINGKNGLIEIKYPHPNLVNTLKETYGVILYQEQVMKIANVMAGFSLGEADLLRRAMGKKKVEIMQQNREKFINQSVIRGYTEEKATEMFELIDKFAGYGFNKSHSAAYALIAYYTAYFKAFYPKYYYAALLTSEMSHIENIAYYVEDAKIHNIKLHLPDVNKPSSKFIVDEEGVIFSLAAIKNVGVNIAQNIYLEHKKNGHFLDYEDFVVRTRAYGMNKKALESLILAGALDSLPGNRHEKYESIDEIIEFANKKNKEDDIQQMNLFGKAKLGIKTYIMPELEDYTLTEILEKEKEYLGFYFSAHPLDKYKNIIDAMRLKSIDEIKEEVDSESIMAYGIITNIKKIVTKKNDIMAVFELEDYFGKLNVVIFPRDYQKYMYYMREGQIVCLRGNLQLDYFKGAENKKLLVRDVILFEDLIRNPRNRLYILLSSDDRDKFMRLKKLLKIYEGNVKTYFVNKAKNNREIVLSKYKVKLSREFLEDLVNLMGREKIYIR